MWNKITTCEQVENQDKSKAKNISSIYDLEPSYNINSLWQV